jgi:hypothetical protein
MFLDYLRLYFLLIRLLIYLRSFLIIIKDDGCLVSIEYVIFLLYL